MISCSAFLVILVPTLGVLNQPGGGLACDPNLSLSDTSPIAKGMALKTAGEVVIRDCSGWVLWLCHLVVVGICPMVPMRLQQQRTARQEKKSCWQNVNPTNPQRKHNVAGSSTQPCPSARLIAVHCKHRRVYRAHASWGDSTPQPAAAGWGLYC